MELHFPVIGFARKWIETFQAASFRGGLVKSRKSFIRTAFGAEEKIARDQGTNSKHDRFSTRSGDKCRDPNVLFRQTCVQVLENFQPKTAIVNCLDQWRGQAVE